MRVAIIGGGVAGLAAAYELEKKGIQYTLFEAAPRLGGVISSEIVDGAVLELGPDSFLSEKPQAAELARELGLGDQLVGSNDAERKTFILVKNRLVPLPDGLMFLIPTKLIPTALTGLFSIGTKIRMGLELLHPPRKTDGRDESVADLVRRHYGREAVDRLADPLLSGIYGGDSSQLSAQTVLPKLVEMEREYGSLTRGMLASYDKMRKAMKNRAISAGPSATNSVSKSAEGRAAMNQSSGQGSAARTIFTTLKGGMRQLTDALTAKLNPANIRLRTPVSAVEPTGTGWIVRTGSVDAGPAAEQNFDAVIIATQAWAAGRLLERVDPALAADLTGVTYSSSVTVNIVYDDESALKLPEGFGFLVPASEGRSMLACTFVHRKFLGRTPAGKAVLRAFLGGMRGEALLSETDADLIATVRRELKEILGITAEPSATRVTRWSRSMAQYSVGHNERKARIAERVGKLKGLYLAGNAYDGIGISDCIRLGKKAVADSLASI